MKIKNITLKNEVLLAPMAGVSDVAFRSLCVACGADYAVCEMVSAKALKYRSKKTLDLLVTDPRETVKVAQLFGNDPKTMRDAVLSEALSKFDIIDINMGCPAPKIVSNGEGSALMLNLERARAVIEACVQATDKPITVKFRKGWSADQANAVEFAKMCEQAGASAITVHGRTKEDGYSGEADWDIIKQVKLAVSIPVIGNGDVCDAKSAQKMRAYTGCDAVMVGRAALGNPAVFCEILGTKPPMTKAQMVLEHVEKLLSIYPERYVVKYMRKHFLWYLKAQRFSAAVKNQIVTKTKLSEALSLVLEVLNKK